MICLDTNAVIAILNDRPDGVRQKFDATRGAETSIVLSIVVYHELMYGAAASDRRQQNEQKIALFLSSASIGLVDFTEADAREAADIRACLKRAGSPIGPYDVLIAAQARRLGATLVTANGREFDRVPGLTVVNWAG
jgi:tRNA(fMet)-specific endonuclease VapC